MSKAKTVKVLKVVLNVVLWLFLLFAMLMTVMVITSTTNSDGLPKMFGKYIITISSDSMKPEFSAGDMIIDEPLTADEKTDLAVDDVITFYADLDGDGAKDEINTHRIISVSKEGAFTYYQTKGDNNQAQDGYRVVDTDIIGKWNGSKIGGVGGMLAFLHTSTGFFVCIIIPLLLFFFWELYSFIKTLVAVKAKKAADDALTPDVEEAIRQRAIADYLKEQAAKQEQKTPESKPEPTPEPTPECEDKK